MEKETYKVAKEILDKFGDRSSAVGRQPLPGMSAVFRQGAPGAPGAAGAGSESQLRR